MKATNFLLNSFTYRQTAIFLIVAFTLIRGIIAFNMELGTDEAYYWLYSQHIKLNYFDHPPLIAFFIRLSTGNLFLQSQEGFIRLGSVLGCAASSWFIYKTCTLLSTPRAGLFGVILYNTSFFAAVTAGIFIMPDAPLMVFYTLCLLAIARISMDEDNWNNWILFGLASGLSLMSKIYGVLPWIGLGIYILLHKRTWLSKKQLYASIAIALVISIPILLWNFKYHFVTHKFQASRLTVEKAQLDIVSFFRELCNQLLYNNPFNVIMIGMAIAAFIENKTGRLQALTIYNYIALPFACLLLIISLNRDTTLPHWSGPAYVALTPLAAIYLDSLKKSFPRMLWATVAGFFLFIVIWQGLIQFYNGSLGGESLASDKSKGVEKEQKLLSVLDGFTKMQLVAEPLNSWKEAEGEFIAIYRNDIRNGVMKQGSPVICYKWWGAQIEYYFCYNANILMIGLGTLDELHEYMWTNTLRKKKVDMNSAYCIVPLDTEYDVFAKFSSYYKFISLARQISVKRDCRPPVYFNIYRLSGWKNSLPFIKY